MVRGEGKLLLAPGRIAVAGVSQLLLQALLQTVHLPLLALCQSLVEVSAHQRADLKTQDSNRSVSSGCDMARSFLSVVLQLHSTKSEHGCVV